MNQVIILAAGKGNRMNSNHPKVLVKVGGEAIISRLLKNVRAVFDEPTLVVGFGSEKIIEEIGRNAEYVYQAEQLGTGHAVSCAKEKLEKKIFSNNILLCHKI